MKVAVVGLGVAGLSVCGRIAAAGHEVLGFEKYSLGAAQGSSRGEARIFRLVPGEGAAYVDLAQRAQQGWRDLEARTGIPLINWTSGYMAGPSGSDFVNSCIRLASEYGRPYKVVDAVDVEGLSGGWQRFPADWLVCRLEDCGVIHASEAVAALAQVARDDGARLFGETAIRAPIDRGRLSINGNWVEFDRIVVTAGPWMSGLLPEMSGYLTVTRKTVASFPPRSGTVQPRNLSVMCLDDEQGCYALPTPSGKFKVGMDTVGAVGVDPDDPAWPVAEEIVEIGNAVRRYLPNHEVIPAISELCFYTMTADWNFLVCEAAANPHVLCMSCCSGHGFKHAPALGEIALGWLEGRDNPFLEYFGRGAGRAAPVVQVGNPDPGKSAAADARRRLY